MRPEALPPHRCSEEGLPGPSWQAHWIPPNVESTNLRWHLAGDGWPARTWTGRGRRINRVIGLACRAAFAAPTVIRPRPALSLSNGPSHTGPRLLCRYRSVHASLNTSEKVRPANDPARSPRIGADPSSSRKPNGRQHLLRGPSELVGQWNLARRRVARPISISSRVGASAPAIQSPAPDKRAHDRASVRMTPRRRAGPERSDRVDRSFSS